jgi:hypothetical protein
LDLETVLVVESNGERVGRDINIGMIGFINIRPGRLGTIIRALEC